MTEWCGLNLHKINTRQNSFASAVVDFYGSQIKGFYSNSGKEKLSDSILLQFPLVIIISTCATTVTLILLVHYCHRILL